MRGYDLLRISRCQRCLAAGPGEWSILNKLIPTLNSDNPELAGEKLWRSQKTKNIKNTRVMRRIV